MPDPDSSTTPGQATSTNTPSNAGVSLDHVSFGYGETSVLHDITLRVSEGQFLTLLGPSGCGKTTLLKILGGYLAPTSGSVLIRHRNVTALPPECRNAGMVFQNYALFPHLTARQNVAFGLEVRGVPRQERESRVSSMLERVGLTVEECNRKPAALSGGQQQRVALARALVIEPDVLLLDEPLANLDRHLRERLRTELRNLQQQTGVTTILVTHDQDEALAVSDVVAVMAAGTVLQFGSPTEVYERPRTPFVATFLGAVNWIDGRVIGQPTQRVMIRPEHCEIDPSDDRVLLRATGRVFHVSYLGADRVLHVRCDNGMSIRVRTRATAFVSPGRTVVVGFPESHLWRVPDSDPPELTVNLAEAIATQSPFPPV